MQLAHVIFRKNGSASDRLTFSFVEGLIDEKYTLLHENGEVVHDGETVRPLGQGGFGVVCRVSDRLGIDRALKILPGLAEVTGGTGLTDVFHKEVVLANTRPFKHVVPIIAYGITRDVQRHDFAYHVSPFVPGHPLETFMDQLLSISSDQLFNDRRCVQRLHDATIGFATTLFDALAELHSAMVMHVDIKPTNLLVYGATPHQLVTAIQPPSPELFVIDLGAGKAMTPLPEGTTHLRYSPHWFPLHLLSELQAPGQPGTYRWACLERHWRSIDLECAGKVLEWMFLDGKRRGSSWLPLVDEKREAVKEQLWKHVFKDDWDVLSNIIDHIVRDNFPSARAVADKLRVIRKYTDTDVFASARLMDGAASQDIATSVGLIKVAEPFADIIGHPCFQRLRRIQQLSFVSESLPDGVHTRYSHSLRTFSLCKQFVFALSRKSVFRYAFDRKDVDTLLAAALLHDVGQYPFSHALEDLRKTGDLFEDAKLRTIGHDHELAKFVLQVEFDDFSPISKFLEAYDLSVEEILYLFQKTAQDFTRRPALTLGRDILSGLIDVDRLSYLTHDSSSTGVVFGRAVDPEAIANALTVKWTPRINGYRAELGIEEHGLAHVEAVLVSLYLMYRHVYWSEENRARMAAFKHVIGTMIRNDFVEFGTMFYDMMQMSDWEALRWVLTRYNNFLHDQRTDEVNPIEGLANLRQLRYRCVCRINQREVHGERDEALAERLLYLQLLRTAYPDNQDKLIEAVRNMFPRQHRPKIGEVLIDIPMKRRLKDDDEAVSSVPETQGEAGVHSNVWVCLRRPASSDIIAWKQLLKHSQLAWYMHRIEDAASRIIRVFIADKALCRISPKELRRIEEEIPSVLRVVSSNWRPASSFLKVQRIR